ncbi:poly [ADP-ribose] polymerase tankyrase-like [Lineus longissimus]|uniref:poly [ADP-ribose] polymerase tankyrase-like n=1 Tax=Lineus longissimus TaxID=88925 RepID=UPI002B4DEBA4
METEKPAKGVKKETDASVTPTTSPAKVKTEKSPAKAKAAEVVKNEQKSTDEEMVTPPRTRKRRGVQPTPEATTPKDTPKRRKTQTTFYQSPIVAVTPASKSNSNGSTSSKSTPAEREQLFKKGKFLAVRNADAGFYLCQAAQNVFKGCKPFKIRWLTNDEGPSDTFKLDFYDTVELETVLTSVNMKYVNKELYILPKKEKEKAEKILKKALNAEKGIVEPEPDEDEDEEEEYEEEVEEEEDEEEEEPAPAKKSKRTSPRSKSKGRASPRKTAQAAVVNKGSRVKLKASKPKKKAPVSPPAKGKAKAKPSPKLKTPSPGGRKHANDRLKMNTAVKVLERDPFFESRETVPAMDTVIASKLVFRAVQLNDMKLLQRYVDDVKHIAKLDMKRSISMRETALEMAIKNENQKAFEILYRAVFKEKAERVKPPPNILSTIGTGTYNVRSLGIPSIRKLTMSRGSREGNNALLKDNDDVYISTSDKDVYMAAIQAGVKPAFFTRIMTNGIKDIDYSNAHSRIYEMVRRGHRKLAGHVLSNYIASGNFGFNALHEQVLLLDKDDLPPSIKSVSVKKKPYDNAGVTPLHCAAINPNVKYLTKLLTILPEYNIMDKNHWRPIHYAAACEGPGPLELLLSRGVNADETETEGKTPLMIAADCGRVKNVELLLKKAQGEKEGSKTENPLTNKWGLAGVNRSTRFGVCAIHMAAKNEHMDVMKVLLKYGVDINKAQSAGRNKATALMEASGMGNLEMVQLLVQNKATIEGKDRMKRTALMYAVMNGHAHVASYFLHLGANPNHVDSSGNTCLHYAVAYGWYYCMHLLVQAGADASLVNSWKVSAVNFAFLKGHIGLMDKLLEEPNVDINFKDDSGINLVMMATDCTVSEGLMEQLEHIVNDHNGDCTITDVEGNNCLHHLAQNLPQNEEQEKFSMKIAELLISKECDINQKNKKGQTPTMVAMATANIEMVKFFVQNGGILSTEVDQNGNNSLHVMAKNCLENDMASLLPVLAKSAATKNEDGWGPVKAMAKVVNYEGFTPLLLAAHTYSTWSRWGAENVRVQYLANGRSFLQALIEKADSSITVTVDKIKESHRKTKDEDMSDGDDSGNSEDDEDEDDNGVEQEGPSIEEDAVAAAKQGENKNQDPYGPCGKWSLVHFLTQVKSEDNEDVVKLPALMMLLEHKPPLDLIDKEGHTPLFIAINDKKPYIANVLIDAGADVNIASENEKADGKSSPLVMAVRKNQCEVVERLIKKGADVNTVDHRNQNTALHYAAMNKGGSPGNPLQVLNLLLDAKADVNALNNRKRTPLHLAVNANSGSTNETTDVEELLLEKGADIFARDVRGRVPLHYTFVKIGNHKNTSALDPIELCNTMTSAMKNVDLDLQDVFGQTPLHLAARRGATVCFMHLTQPQRKVNIDSKDNLGNTPLSLAVLAGHDSCAISLIQKGANINVSCVIAPEEDRSKEKKDEKPVWKWKPLKATPPLENQKCPLFLGVIQKDWQGVTYIILDLLDNFGVPYTQCVECSLNVEKYQLALRLINRMKDHSRLAILNNEKQNLFHVLCQSTGDHNMQLKVADALLSKGIPVNDRDMYGCTPLHYAALTINKPLAKFLLEKTSDAVATVDSLGRTALAALFWDLEHNMTVDEDFCQLLLDKGGQLNILCDYPAFHPAYYGSKVPASSTRYHTKLDTDRIAPLAYAVGLKNFDLAKMLLKLGASVNVRDSKNRTPIMYAVRQNDIHMLKLLLDHSYDKDAKKEKDDKTKPKLVKKKSVVQKRIFQLKKIDSFKQNVDDDDKESKDEAEVEVKVKETGNNRRKSTQLDDDVELKFEEFPKKSDVDLTVQDDQAWTVIHHLASPLEVGSYDNLEMLKILVDNGAPLTEKDRAGLTALDCALNNGATKLSKGIQKLLAIEKEKWEKPTYQSLEINDSIKWSSPPLDFEDDSKAFLSKLEESAMDTSESKSLLEPDHRVQAHVDSQGEIVMDEDQDIPYDALLNKVDVNASAWGMYNFYILQLVRHKVKDMYILFTRWGRLGDEGNFQQTPFPTFEETVKEFRKVFKEKTGNDWSNVKSFEKQHKKWCLVQREDKRTKPPEVKFNLKSPKSSLLPAEIQHIIKEFTNVQALETSMKGLGVDYEFMPLGRIKKEALLEARLILGKLSESIEKKDKHMNGEEKLDLPDYQKLCEEIVQFSNDYYQLVPQHGYVYESIRPIDMDYEIKENKRLIDNLLDLAIASKVICAAQQRVEAINPLDYVYRTIECKIQLMLEDDPMTQYILQYVHNTGGDSASVEAIFKISRAGEEERFQKCGLTNRKLLFHGTYTANMISILKRGLLIAPPEAPRCGAMFGDGIYFADSFSKSRNYCCNRYTHTGATETAFMFVAEVALGNVKEYYDAEDGPIEKKYNSTVGIGSQQPDPRYDICLPTGAVIPLGSTIPTPKPDKDDDDDYFYFNLNQNEYIIYDEAQACLRYIIQFR